MKKNEDRCVCCAVPAYPCIGALCPNKNVSVFYCDKCGEEMDDVFLVEGDQLCEDCLKEKFLKNKGDL